MLVDDDPHHLVRVAYSNLDGLVEILLGGKDLRV